ncbi:hypothetical protein [Dankookia sp. P2]|uniref:hypothetical protein n=1 Tax=Dankookia sp. P2 TaxID=3423955 RepID=UPI003D66469A
MPAFVPPGVIGHNRSLFARNYAILPPGGMFPSLLPGLRDAQVYYQATPLMGARFAQGTLEVLPGGGTTAPRDDGYEHFLYLLSGTLEVAAGRDLGQPGAGRLRLHPGRHRPVLRQQGRGCVAQRLDQAPLRPRPRPGRPRPALRQPRHHAAHHGRRQRPLAAIPARHRRYDHGFRDERDGLRARYAFPLRRDSYLRARAGHAGRPGPSACWTATGTSSGPGISSGWAASSRSNSTARVGEGAAYLLYKDVNRDVEV